MILNPGILSLIIGSLLSAGFSVYAAVIGLQIIRWWNSASGDELQLKFERQTHLITAILSYIAAFEFFALFLFIYTADHIHLQFVGAMCAAGSLNVNPYGYPTLILKIVNVFICGVWMVVNHADNQAPDYPLIRYKYKFILLIALLLVLEAFFQINYFRDMAANVITTCCGVLFNEDARTFAGGTASLPSLPTQAVFFISMAVLFRVGVQFLTSRRPGRLFGWLSNWAFIVSLVSVIVFISVFYYELPTHHCPFDLLQKEYNYIGYPLYAFLFTAGISGAGVGILEKFRRIESLSDVIPALQFKLCISSMFGFILFTSLSIYPMIFSDFRLTGY